MATPEQLNQWLAEGIANKETERKQGLFVGILLATFTLGEITGVIMKHSIGESIVILLLCAFFSYGLFMVLENIKR